MASHFMPTGVCLMLAETLSRILICCFVSAKTGLNQRFEVRILGCGRDLWQRFDQRVFRVSNVLQGVMKSVSESLRDLVLF